MVQCLGHYSFVMSTKVDLSQNIHFVSLASEQVVIRSFPVSSLFKVKILHVHDIPRVSEIKKTLQVSM